MATDRRNKNIAALDIGVELLTREEAAAFLHKNLRVLRFWRTAGIGGRNREAWYNDMLGYWKHSSGQCASSPIRAMFAELDGDNQQRSRTALPEPVFVAPTMLIVLPARRFGDHPEGDDRTTCPQPAEQKPLPVPQVIEAGVC